MRILMVAPQPFYEERGTPIAVDLILQTLSERGDQVDLMTYHLGQDVHYDGVNIYRIRNIPFVREVIPGFSWKKVVCDTVMVFQLLPMLLSKRYQIVHAVEEAVFMALLFKWVFKVPYIYDMDSSLVQQLIDQHPVLFKPVSFILRYLEGLAIRNAMAVVPVCDALFEGIEKYRPEKVTILRDISLLKWMDHPEKELLKDELGIEGPLLMYVGNLEPYQGIDLLLESFSLISKEAGSAGLVIIGGKETDVERYKRKSELLGIDSQVYLIGPRPVDHLAYYLDQADFLVSPRVQGTNTPMKVYSYLDSGKALLATRLPTHTQILNDEVALLVKPCPEDFAEGLLQLIRDEDKRTLLGQAGKRLIEERHTLRIFHEGLNTLYGWLKTQIAESAQPLPASTIEQGCLDVEEQRLRLFYQPIVSLTTGNIIGFEALVRRLGEDGEMIAPREFISQAEDSGEIISIGRWVLQEACRQTHQWEIKYPSRLPMNIAVNLSAKQFMEPGLIDHIDQVLAETGLDPHNLKLEVKDQTLLDSAESASERASQLVARGVQLEIDYVGNDANLSVLKNVPASTLKLDPAFLSRMESEDAEIGAVQRAVEAAQKSGLDVIAVGVETLEQLAHLRALHCEYGQGFYFCQPVEGESVEELIEKSPSWLNRAS
jgi:EAL domain-containing protein (putative c-di-GMP-specific phosphodiesterase class I)/glycosyltransferase involved in cell wall biosynthesis